MARRQSTALPQPYVPNRILGWFYARFFSHIVVDERWQGVVRNAADRGVVVYVMRSLSFLDFLCLDYLTKRFALPLIHFANDLGLWILEPFGKGHRRLRFRRQVPEDDALRATLRERFSALLFLRRPAGLFERGRKRPDRRADLLRTLIEAQRRTEAPILLVPQTFVWTKLPPSKRKGLLDAFFGPVDSPGKIRVAFQFLLNFRNTLLRAGDPFDLKAFVSQHEDLTDQQLADKVRLALLRIMERERTLVLGPSVKSPGRIRDELLRSPRVVKHVEAQARQSNKPVGRVLRQARRDLKRLMAAQSPIALSIAHLLLDRLWNRIYDGIELDRPGLERVRAAAREGTLILLPCHKSHVDYLVLSDILYQHQLVPPLIASGDNLNFFPAGPILRRCGAFFIRRSFKGKRLYSALVDAYLRKLIVEGFNIEFFLEGGRSRTGKLLEPRLGLLSMLVDAGLLLPRKKVFFVPVSISYERVVEERSYVHEAEGGEKQRESVGQLLKSTRVLRSRFGRLYVQFGEVLSLDGQKKELLEERGRGDDGTQTVLRPTEKRTLIRRIAYRVIDQISRVTVVTPSALVASALLAQRRQGMRHEELVRRCQHLTVALKDQGTRFATLLLDQDGELRVKTLRETVRLFVGARLLTVQGEGDTAVYSVPEERRIAVEYYKNNILHFFVPRALIAASLLTAEDGPAERARLRSRVQELSRLFKHEFIYRADAGFDDIFEEQLSGMIRDGELVQHETTILLGDRSGSERVRLYADMIRTYFESYRLALRGAELLDHGSMSKREWIKKTLALGQRMYLSGEIELRESLSKHRLNSASRALKDQNVIRGSRSDVFEAAEAKHEGSRAILEAQITTAFML